MAFTTSRSSFLCGAFASSMFAAGLLTGCGDNGGGAADETGGTTTGDPDTTTSTTAEGSSTGTTGDSTGASEETGGTPAGVCVGYTNAGEVATAFVREGETAGELTCSAEVMACGGEAVGTWNATTNCGFEDFANPLADMCPGSTFEIDSVVPEGTLTFGDDGSFEQDVTTTIDFTVVLDTNACFGVPCGAATLYLNTQPNTSGSCEDVEGGLCRCAVTMTQSEVMAGTYVTADDEILMTVDGEDLQPQPYCVDGGTRLDLWTSVAVPTETTQACSDAADCEAALGDDYAWYDCIGSDDAEAPAPGHRAAPIRRR